MTRTLQTPETRLRAVSIALALAIVLVAAVVATPSVQAKDFKVLYSFTCGADGCNPYGGLILDPAGNLYGTDTYGCDGGGGTVFKLDEAGKLTVLYCFQYNNGSPMSDLVRDAAGNLYTTTTAWVGEGPGAVFMVSGKGKGKQLYFFCKSGGKCTDGAIPYGGLVRDAVGNLYGTNSYGGSGCYDCGTVFKLDKAGKETVLYSFKGGKDGANPYASLVLDAKGNLYGTTYNGGGASNLGTVFMVDKTGKETVLHRFIGTGGDAANPWAGLVRDQAGNLYGATVGGGAFGNGAVFKVNKTGKETVLYSFTGTGGDGANPYATLVRDAKDNLYGTTFAGGASGLGTVFMLDKTGKETVLHTFSGGRRDGAGPYGALVRDAKGNLYGTAFDGGTHRYGVVFKLTP
jgi:uncharacterized repeat protein (TIGR03803 family)